MESFENCLDTGKYSERVKKNLQEARKIGARSTPTFVIVGPDGQQQQFSGAQPFVTFKQIMDPML